MLRIVVRIKFVDFSESTLQTLMHLTQHKLYENTLVQEADDWRSSVLVKGHAVTIREDSGPRPSLLRSSLL